MPSDLISAECVRRTRSEDVVDRATEGVVHLGPQPSLTLRATPDLTSECVLNSEHTISTDA